MIVGVGIGGTKDQCVTLGKEASCLRLVGDRHPDPLVAELELELLELGNRTMIGIMGFQSDTPVIDVHVEIAYTHTGGLPIGISELCHAVRRATARVYNDGRVEYREDPQWFTTTAAKGRIRPARPAGDGMKPRRRRGRDGLPWPASRPPTDPARRPPRVREWHLNIPLSEADVRQLRAGDVVYLTGCIFTARDGVFKYMIDEGHAPPIDIRDQFNVTTQSSPAGTETAPASTWSTRSRRPPASATPSGWIGCGDATACARSSTKAACRSRCTRPSSKHGAVCLSTMPYGIGAIYGKAVNGVRDVYWKELLGISEAMWLLEVRELGPLLVDGDSGQQLRRRPRGRGRRAADGSLRGPAEADPEPPGRGVRPARETWRAAESGRMRRARPVDLRCDVLILGGGGAGLLAALHASSRPRAWTSWSRRKAWWRRAAARGWCRGATTPSSTRATRSTCTFADTLAGGGFLNDQELAWTLVNGRPAPGPSWRTATAASSTATRTGGSTRSRSPGSRSTAPSTAAT